MLSLEKSVGLPIQIKEDFSLDFGGGLLDVHPDVREFPSMRNYLKDPSSTFSRRDVYHIYRDVCFANDKEKLLAANLQYDLTVMPSGKIGKEFVKTIGHYHNEKPGTGAAYPEVYEVIHGQVFWLLQSASRDFERLEKVFLLTAGKGEKVVFPPGFGHITINPSDETLVIANWKSRDCRGNYEPYEIHNGGAYYICESQRLLASGSTAADMDFLPNLSYNHVPPIEKASPRELPQFDLRTALPSYFTVTKNPSSVDFLANPENYLEELIPEKLFK